MEASGILKFFKLPQCSPEQSIVYNDFCPFFITLIEALLKSNCFAGVYSISVTFLKTRN